MPRMTLRGQLALSRQHLPMADAPRVAGNAAHASVALSAWWRQQAAQPLRLSVDSIVLVTWQAEFEALCCEVERRRLPAADALVMADVAAHAGDSEHFFLFVEQLRAPFRRSPGVRPGVLRVLCPWPGQCGTNSTPGIHASAGC